MRTLLLPLVLTGCAGMIQIDAGSRTNRRVVVSGAPTARAARHVDASAAATATTAGAEVFVDTERTEDVVVEGAGVDATGAVVVAEAVDETGAVIVAGARERADGVVVEASGDRGAVFGERGSASVGADVFVDGARDGHSASGSVASPSGSGSASTSGSGASASTATAVWGSSGEGFGSGSASAPGAGSAVGARSASGASAAAPGSAGAGAVSGAASGSGSAASSAAGSASTEGVASARRSTSVEVDIDAVLRGTPGAAPERVGGGAGVRAIGGGRARLGGLLEGGVVVDRYRLRLGDLGPLAPGADVEATARLATDVSIEAEASLEHATLPRGGGETNLVVRVRGGEAETTARSPLRVHLVVDRSSSMHRAWPDVLAAASALVGTLHADDHLQIVAYGGDAEEVLPPTRVGSGASARAALGRISVGGGTNIEAGLDLAYGAVGRARLVGNERAVVILLSDGVPNGGAFSAEELAPMATHAQRTHGCTTTTIGLGHQFDGDVLRAISNAGAGRYHVARGSDELEAMLQAELEVQQRIAVRDVSVNVALPVGVRVQSELDALDAQGIARSDAGVRLELPQLAAGEERRVVIPVYVPANVTRVASVELGYRGRAGARTVRKDVTVAFGARAELASERQRWAVADKDLGRAIDAAADHVLNGRHEQAIATLNAHVARVEAGGAIRGELRFRTEAVGRLATSLDTLVPRASHTERRELGLAMGALASRLFR